jgi:DNA-binding winged helix-turn-helix (wHTH) protein/tetratricopeptide (TPR) repeat protein
MIPVPMLVVGRWTVDPREGTLAADGRVVRLEPKVMAVLLFLLERRGTVVTHDELLEGVWRDTHVAPGALARSISILRRELDDDAKRPTYIHTIPKRGYRLDVPAPAGVAADSARRWRVHWWALAGALALLGLIASVNRRAAAPEPKRSIFTGRFVDRSRTGNESAYAYYARALAADPTSSDAHAGVSIAYAFRGDYLPEPARWRSAAIDLAMRALAIDSGNPNAVKALGLAHLKAGRFTDAAAVYRRALAMLPDDLGIYSNLGAAYLSLGDVRDALPLFQQRVTRDPEHALGYVRLSEALADAGFQDEATEMAARALLFEPYARVAQLLLVRRDLLAARYDAAQVRLERLLEVDAGCVRCRVQLGLVDQLAGRFAAAERRYRVALATDMDRTPAMLRLGQLYLMEGRRAEAAALLKGVVAVARRTIANGIAAPGPRWALAGALAVEGDRTEALRWFRATVDAGRRDADWDAWDPLFANIRDDARFAEAIAGARAAAAPLRGAVAAVMSRLEPTLQTVDRRFGPELRVPMFRADPPGWPSVLDSEPWRASGR